MNWTKLPPGLHIIKPEPMNYVDETIPLTGWMDEPQTWVKQDFLQKADSSTKCNFD